MLLEKAKFAIEKLKNQIGRLDTYQRRAMLIERMDELDQKSMGCQSCQGFCCEFSNNSMQIDLIQGLELLEYLVDSEQLNDQLIKRLKDNVSTFRLDRELTTGTNTVLRRYYTCPFFMYKKLGCSIAPGAKPYGCLGFNALEENVSQEGKCSSDLQRLRDRQEQFRDQELGLNKALADHLSIWWDKKPIPSALLDLCKALNLIN